MIYNLQISTPMILPRPNNSEEAVEDRLRVFFSEFPIPMFFLSIDPILFDMNDDGCPFPTIDIVILSYMVERVPCY